MSLKVLIIEDNPDNRKLISWLLEDEGIEFFAVETAEEGLKILDSGDFDLVLMDISLPGMDGMEATRRIRSQDRFKDLPVLAVTAHAVKGISEKTLESGISELVTKPFDQDELVALIRDYGKVGAEHD